MFIEDGSLQYIEADAQDVLAMFRSTSTVMIAHGRREKQPCEAFVCVVQEGAVSTAYVALSMQKTKSFVIYVPQNKPVDKDASDAVVQDALDFAREFGFEMQGVNLNYSKALREVVLNDLRVVRSGSGGKRVSQKKVPAEKTAKGTAVVTEKRGETADASGQKAVVSGTATGKEFGTVESMEKMAASQGEDKEIRPAMPKEGRDKGGAGSDSVQDSGITAIRAEKERLKDEKKRIEKEAEIELAAFQMEIASITREIQSLSAERKSRAESAKAEIERLSMVKAAEQKASGDELASLDKKIEALKKEAKADEDTYSRQIREAMHEIEKLSAEKVELENRGFAELSAKKSEVKRLLEEKETAQKDREKEIAVLRRDVERLSSQESTDEDLIALKAEFERLVSERNDAQKALVAELSTLNEQIACLEEEKKQIEQGGERDLASLRSQLEALKQQKSDKEKAIGNELTTLREELEFLRGEHEAAGDAASAEISALRSEKERLVEERARIEQELSSEINQLKSERDLLEEEMNNTQQSFAGVLSELRGDMERLSSQKESMERASAEERSALHDSVRMLEEDIAAHGDASKKQLDDLRRQVEQLSDQKRVELEAASAEMSLLNAEVARLQKESAEFRENAVSEIEAIKVEIARLSEGMEAERGKASAELTALREEAARLSQVKAELEASSASEVEAAREMVSRLASEVDELKKESAEKVAVLCSDAERLMQEREAAEQRAEAAVTAAREEIERLASELLHSGNAIMEVIASTHAEVLGRWERLPEKTFIEGNSGVSKEEIVSVQREPVRVSDEETTENNEIVELETVDLWETDTHESFDMKAGEELRGEIEDQTLVADAGQPGEMPESETATPAHETQLSSHDGGRENVKTEEEFAVGEIAGEGIGFTDDLDEEIADDAGSEAVLEGENVSSEMNSSDPFSFLHGGETQMGAFSTMPLSETGPSGPPVQFAINKSLSAVEYQSPNDIVEIYQSLNRTRVAMEDHTTLTCDAYLCGITRGSRYYVYIALYLVDTKGILVYSPEVQPEDSGTFAKILRDGMDFVEIVGFMMDTVDLGVNETQRVKALNKIPVLRKVSP